MFISIFILARRAETEFTFQLRWLIDDSGIAKLFQVNKNGSKGEDHSKHMRHDPITTDFIINLGKREGKENGLLLMVNKISVVILIGT